MEIVPFIVQSRGDKVSEVTPVDNIELGVSSELKDTIGSIESHLVNTENALKSNDSETKEWGVKGENSSSSDTTKQVKGKGYIVNKIISGGQTGVDTIGLEVGNKLGIETGGTATPSFITEKGKYSIDKKYGLKEISSELQNGERVTGFICLGLGRM